MLVKCFTNGAVKIITLFATKCRVDFVHSWSLSHGVHREHFRKIIARYVRSCKSYSLLGPLAYLNKIAQSMVCGGHIFESQTAERIVWGDACPSRLENMDARMIFCRGASPEATAPVYMWMTKNSWWLHSRNWKRLVGFIVLWNSGIIHALTITTVLSHILFLSQNLGCNCTPLHPACGRQC